MLTSGVEELPLRASARVAGEGRPRLLEVEVVLLVGQEVPVLGLHQVPGRIDLRLNLRGLGVLRVL